MYNDYVLLPTPGDSPLHPKSTAVSTNAFLQLNIGFPSLIDREGGQTDFLGRGIEPQAPIPVDWGAQVDI